MARTYTQNGEEEQSSHNSLSIVLLNDRLVSVSILYRKKMKRSHNYFLYLLWRMSMIGISHNRYTDELKHLIKNICKINFLSDCIASTRITANTTKNRTVPAKMGTLCEWGQYGFKATELCVKAIIFRL